MPMPASSAPGDGTTTDPEGGTPTLRKALENASRGWTDARNKVNASRKRQADLVKQQRATEQRVAALTKEVQELAVAAYQGGRMNMLTAALDSGSLPAFIDKSQMIDQLSFQNSEQFKALTAAREDLARQKRKIDGELKIQQAQEKAMAKRKGDAEKALALVGGGASGGFSGSSRAARSAPRNSDGSFSSESCSVDDPTSGGCITPRMSHALQQARAAGFSRFTHCWREASFGEHQKGRACDFAASPDGFGDTATGAEKEYGNRLAAYFVNNSDRLAVLYVIWFRQIWMPSTGWRAYDGGSDPSSAHTNHVHLSVQ
jgi:hypothetical protein